MKSESSTAGEVGDVLQIDSGAELGEDVVAQGVQVPGVGVLVVGAAQVEELLDDALHHLHDALLLVAALEQLAAHAVYRLALLVHHVVVFQEVFAGLEILHFDGFLGLGDALGDELALDRHVLFHTQAEHEVLHALAAENAQQVVLQRKEESRAAGVALAAGASAELVVDAAGLMPFGGHDMQAAQGHYFIVLGIRLPFVTGVDLVPFVAAHAVELVVVGEVIEVLVGDVLGFAFRIAFRPPFPSGRRPWS